MQEAEIDEQIDKRVLVGNGGAVAQMRTLDTEGGGLRINSLNGRALFVDVLVRLAVAVEGVTQAGADRGGHHGGATALLPELVMNRAGVGDTFREQQRTNIFAALMLDQTRGAVGESKLEGHGQTGLADRQPIGRELAIGNGLATLLREGHGGESPGGGWLASGCGKIVVDIPGVESGIESAELRAIVRGVARPEP